MNQTIFKTVKNLELNNKSLDNYSKEILKKFIKFIESGIYTDSPSEKYIASNFRLGATEMTNKWNLEHRSKPKSANTFRSQISIMSSFLLKIFSISTSELNEMFISGDRIKLSRLRTIINSFRLSEINISNRFNYLMSFIPDNIIEKTFNLDDCQKELELLKTFDEDNLKKYFEEIDMEKLLYVIKLSKSSLVKTEYYRDENDNKCRNRSLDTEKLRFCDHLMDISYLKLKSGSFIPVVVEDCADGSGEIEIVEDEVKEELNVEQDNSLVTELGIPEEFAKIIDNCIKDYIEYTVNLKEGETDKYIMNAGSDQEVRKVNTFLNQINVPFIEKYCRNLNPYLLQSILNTKLDEVRKKVK